MADRGPDQDELLARIRELTELLLAADDAPTAFQHVIDMVARTVPGHPGACLTLAGERGPVTVAASTPLTRSLARLQHERGGGPCLTSLRSGCRVMVPDLADERRWDDFPRRAMALGVRSMACFPLTARRGEGVPGALNLCFREPHGIDERGTEISEMIVEHAGLLLGSVLRQVDQDRLNCQLREALAGRAIIDQAIGIVMAQRRVAADTAFALLRQTSQRRNRKLREIAADLVRVTGGGPPRPGTFHDDTKR
ncbi:GAF and ANTAR domain-containing protein [Actinomadura hibisca]|uniref:GAF and ANTAR domain-containing protein n=1 Tax=Actinomadura hibisca TaxID=68565 RepID=UPI000835452D|nr:GAF and ANTAR domain-containing protein [Actinomadura hibisca]